MAFKNIKQSSGEQRELVPAGMQVARCVSLVDFGTQEIEWQGEKKLQRKIYISWELPNELRVFDEKKGEQPMVVGKKYTLSFHKKSTLTKDILSWLGSKKLSGDMQSWLDSEVVGTECMLNITHKEWKGTDYATIVGITPVPNGMKCPKQINESLKFDLEDFEQEKFDKLPEWQQKIIKESPEYNDATGSQAGFTADTDIDEEDLPF